MCYLLWLKMKKLATIFETSRGFKVLWLNQVDNSIINNIFLIKLNKHYTLKIKKANIMKTPTNKKELSFKITFGINTKQ